MAKKKLSATEEILDFCASVKITPSDVDRLLEEHWSCLEFDTCSLCDDEDGFATDILIALAGNEKVLGSQLERIQAAPYDSQGPAQEFITAAIAGNSNITPPLKKYVLDVASFDVWKYSDAEELCDEIYEQISENPKFTPAELDAFARQVQAVYDYDLAHDSNTSELSQHEGGEEKVENSETHLAKFNVTEGKTNFALRCEILADLFVNHRDETELVSQFVANNDLGLPAAYFIDRNYVEANSELAKFVNETFENFLLIGFLGSDTGYKNLQTIFKKGDFTSED